MNTPSKPTREHPLPTFIKPGYENSQTIWKMGFDLHGVVDAMPNEYRKIMGDLMRCGWEIHILTGAPWEKEQMTLEELQIPFTHFFSIVDHHRAIGTPIQWDEKGNAHLDDYLWNQTKAVYCKVHKISVHFDDSDIYGMFFKTPYVRYYSKDTCNDEKRHLC